VAITRTATAIVPDANTPLTRTATAIVPDANTPLTRTATAIVPDAPVLTLYTTAQGAGQFTPSLTLAAGAPTPHWDFGDGTTFDGTDVDHNFTKAGTKTVTITPFSIVDYIVSISIYACSLVGDLGAGFLRYVPQMTRFLYAWSNGSAYLASDTIPPGGSYYGFSGTMVLGHLSDFPTDALTYTVANTSIKAGVPASNAVRRIDANNNNWTQSDIDTVIASIYANRANYTYATPTLNIGGNNAAPSGVYQYAATPTTGKEMIYALVNDPDGEGFNKWTITYTA